MRFLGKVWRLLVGIKDALVLILLLIFFGGLYAALSGRPAVGPGQKGALLLDFAGPIVEEPATPGGFSVISGTSAGREYRLRDVINGLKAAAKDDRIPAVVLDLDRFGGGGQVALTDVGAAMDAVRRANKPVLAYATGYTDDSYQLAAHASEVWVHPMGAVLVTGPGGTGLYYKGLLDKLGVTANVYKVGTYKAATEPFTRNDMSPEARESIQAVASALWESWQNDVHRARPKAQLAAYVANPAAQLTAAGGDMAKAALAAGLVDHVGDRTAFGARVAQIVGAADSGLPGSFKAIRYTAWTRSNPIGKSSGDVGVLTIAGDIIDGEANAGTAGADTITKILRNTLANKDLKALVVRVDSPGGSVTGSEQIRQAIIDAKSTGLPVVVSMGNVAASGGYWISTSADKIYAEPGTITGSIGVFGIIPSFQGTLQKLGVGADGVKTTPLSGEPDVLRGPSPEMGQLIQLGINETYKRFITLVGNARKLPIARVDQIGQGRVWDGGTAHQLGLVDSFGSLSDAIADAARRAKLDPGKASVVFLEKEPSFWDSMLQSYADEDEDDPRDAFSRIAERPSIALAQAVTDAQRLIEGPAIQARCLECPGVPLPRAERQKRTRLATLLASLMP